MEFAPEKLEQAIGEFYQNPGKLSKECHEWLKHFQVSKEAWQVLWVLLDQTKSEEVQYVAANTLFFKVTRCLADIPSTEIPALKDKILNAVAQYVRGPALVSRRLGLTMASFVANTIGLFWNEPLEELANIFQPQNFPGVPDLQVLKLLVQIFGYVPEQNQTQWQQSTKNNVGYRALQAKGETMFTWLFNLLRTQQDPDLIVEIIQALSSWMKLTCICSWSDVLPLVDTLVSLCSTAVASEEDNICTGCTETLSQIIADPSATMYPGLMLDILGKILPLQSSIDVVLVRNDMNLATAFFSLYVAMAECHSKLCVEVVDMENSHTKENSQHRTNATQLFGIILRCTGIPGIYPIEETISSITISVWYSIMEDIQQKQSNELTYARLMLFFDEVYKSLAEILVRKSQYPVDNFDSWSAEDKELFRVYRQDVADCLTYCFELRGWAMLNDLIIWAEHCVENDSLQIERNWPELESVLNAIRAVTENVNDDPQDVMMVDSMTRVFNVIFRVLKFNRERKIPKVFQAAVECITLIYNSCETGSCSVMLHSFDQVAKNVIGFILEGLFQPELATSSALALKTLSRDCSSSLTEFIPQILTSCKQALCGGLLAENDCMRLVYVVGRFVVYLPFDQILTIVEEIFAHGLAQLQNIATVDPDPSLKSQLVSILNMFSTLCSSLDPAINADEEEEEVAVVSSAGGMGAGKTAVIEKARKPPVNEPLIPIVEKILPTLITIAEKWVRDETVMESLLGIVKHTLSTIHLSSSTVIHHSVQLVLISFKSNPLTVTVNLAKQTILMLGKENLPMQCQFLAQIHSLSIDRLRNARENLEFAESYFVIFGQFVRNDPHMIRESGVPLEPILQIAIETLTYSEAPMLKAGIFFVTVCVEKADNSNPILKEFFLLHGHSIVHKLIVSAGCVVPRSSVHYFAELFVAFNRSIPAEWRKWLTDVLALEGFPSSHLQPEVKNKFFMKVTRGQANKRGVQEALNDFAIACRNMSGSEYAKMTSMKY